MAELNESDLARLVYKAKIAEQAECFDDMVKFIRRVIEHKKSLDAGEQKLFAVACKNQIGKIRKAWKLADAARAKYAGNNQQKEQFAAQYAEELAEEILKVCREVESDLKTLANSSTDASSKSIYAKMDADYRRYRCEIEPKETSNAADAYKRATKVSEGLSPAHPTRIGIALNHSVFKYEIENNLNEACLIAQEALDKARAEGIAPGRDAFLIEHLLQDNILLWKSEVPKRKEDFAY